MSEVKTDPVSKGEAGGTAILTPEQALNFFDEDDLIIVDEVGSESSNSKVFMTTKTGEVLVNNTGVSQRINVDVKPKPSTSAAKTKVENEDEVQFLQEVPAQRMNISKKKPKGRKRKHSEVEEVLRPKRQHVFRPTCPSFDNSVFNAVKNYRDKYPKCFENFDQQILDHYLRNIQEDATFSWKMKARSRIFSAIKSVFPQAELYAVGSTINGCGSFSSDMDLCCYLQNENSSRAAAIRCLRRVQKALFRHIRNSMKACSLIQAKVPILKIKLCSEFDGLEVDININNLAGIYNSHLLHYYARIDDRYPALCLLVKHWAKDCGIADAMNGTLNSYSIILLCIHFLQSVVSPPILPNLQNLYPELFSDKCPIHACSLFRTLEPKYPDPKLNTSTVGELAIAFFDYYANFDFGKWGISINRGGVFSRTELDGLDHYYIYVEEPYDFKNTARCVTALDNYYKIVAAFSTARSRFLKKKPDMKNLVFNDVFLQKMAVNVSDRSYRKLDVDSLDPEKYEEVTNTTEQFGSATGPDMAKVKQLIAGNNWIGALKALLESSPTSADTSAKEAMGHTVFKVLTSFKVADMAPVLKSLNVKQQALLTKYIYKCMELVTDSQTSQLLCAWHANTVSLGGPGLINQVLSSHHRL